MASTSFIMRALKRLFFLGIIVALVFSIVMMFSPWTYQTWSPGDPSVPRDYETTPFTTVVEDRTSTSTEFSSRDINTVVSEKSVKMIAYTPNPALSVLTKKQDEFVPSAALPDNTPNSTTTVAFSSSLLSMSAQTTVTVEVATSNQTSSSSAAPLGGNITTYTPSTSATTNRVDAPVSMNVIAIAAEADGSPADHGNPADANPTRPNGVGNGGVSSIASGASSSGAQVDVITKSDNEITTANTLPTTTATAYIPSVEARIVDSLSLVEGNASVLSAVSLNPNATRSTFSDVIPPLFVTVKPSPLESVTSLPSRVISNQERFQTALDFETMYPPSLSSAELKAFYSEVKGSKNIVIYNRLPRCYNMLVLSLFHLISKHNKINTYTDPESHVFAPTIMQQKKWVKHISTYKQPLLYNRHVYLVNFTRFNEPWPVHINLVRDPIERYASRYYLELERCRRRALPGCREIAPARVYTFDECVQRRLPFCTCEDRAGCRGMIPFFCGTNSRCRTSPRWALTKAKRNIQSYYTVVGLTTDLYPFFEVLERLLPVYFRDLPSLYIQRKTEGKLDKYMDKSFQPVSNETVAYLKDKFKYDYYFYNFVKQLFYTQYLALFSVS